ncbi:hypothetical protein CYY_000977 [Polysphondylium violaceum]|uniref:non-specific serine/threonine protein kinase n=1 Tax=Polysphondylium violaceum TaxID=133409 RepID=A0A8J4V201_9MYCE|nr:hypothetical protein CYY_000977 [Polysphondylium violaceum]
MMNIKDIQGLPFSASGDDENDLSSVEYSDLVMDSQEIGRGSFGQVQKASYFGTDVAVKSLSSLVNIDPDYFKFMLREIKILKGMRHPNIVQYIGACLNEGRYMIVTEYIKGGDLHQLLKERGVNAIPWNVKMKLAFDVASAFSYLHSKKVIFRDLKAKNILIDEQGTTLRAKVCDFGFARILDISKDMNANKEGYLTICGSETTMAPEVIVGSNYNDSCDVYSYGVLLLELILGSRVVKTQLKRSPMSAFDMNLEKAEYLAPESCPKDFFDLAKWCCAYQPKNRPSFMTIVKGLKELMASPVDQLPVKGKSKPYKDEESDYDGEQSYDSDDNVNNVNNSSIQIGLDDNNNDGSGNDDNDNINNTISGGENSGYGSVIYNDTDKSAPNIDYGGRKQQNRNIFNLSFFTPPPGVVPIKIEHEEEDEEDQVPEKSLSSLGFDDIKSLIKGSDQSSVLRAISSPNLSLNNPLDSAAPQHLSNSVTGVLSTSKPKKKTSKKSGKKKNHNKIKK